MNNPFFSIIIPCYNSKPTIARLLNSIVQQSMSNDIEVILSDDNSTESYDNEVEPFLSKLNIKRITTDYNCCPGNTREKGVSIATGTWLIFADHDDQFIPNTFRDIKKQILKNKEEYVAYCNIYRSKNTIGKFQDSLIQFKLTNFHGLLHGKVFNRENLWNKFNIHFKKDMFTHEDTYITTVIKCIMEHLNRKPLHIDLYNYVWFNNSKSLSNANGLRDFLEEHFHYYVEATSEVYRDFYNKGLINDNFTVYSLMQVMLCEYFYEQMFIFYKPVDYLNDNVKLCQNDLRLLKQMFKLTNLEIWAYCAKDNAVLYTNVAKEAGYGYILNHSLMQWLNILDADNIE